jgi:hypothetical protein
MNAAPSTDTATKQSRLKPIAEGSGAWRMLAAELLIGLALDDGNMAEARELINELQKETGLTADMSQRLQIISQALEE